jgi:molybdenum cofactor guanylyltransferase
MSYSNNTSASVAILAGGMNSRFSGETKALIPWKGNTLIQHYLLHLQQMTDDLFIISNEPELFFPFTTRVFKDVIPSRGPLSGVHAALSYAEHHSVIVVACDMPFLPVCLIPWLTGLAASHHDMVIIPSYQNRVEPLFSLWPQSVALLLEQWLKVSGDFKIRSFTDTNNLAFYPEVPQGMLHEFSFFNINSPEDLARGNEMNLNLNP